MEEKSHKPDVANIYKSKSEHYKSITLATKHKD